MSGAWKTQGKMRPAKKPRIVGNTVRIKDGNLFIVPLNRKGKALWELARNIGPAPVDQPPVESTVEIADQEEQYAESEE